MTYGLEIKNGSNEIIIDDTTAPMVVSSSGSFQTSLVATTPGGAGIYHYDYSALIPTDGDKVLYLKMPTGFVFTTSKWQGNDVFCCGRSTTIEYIVCDVATNVAAGDGYGLEVFNASSDLVYSSTHELMPSASFLVDIPYQTPSGTEVSVSAGDIWFNGDNGPPTFFSPNLQGGTYFLKNGIYRRSSTVLELGSVGVYWTSQVAPLPNASPAPSFFNCIQR